MDGERYGISSLKVDAVARYATHLPNNNSQAAILPVRVTACIVKDGVTPGALSTVYLLDDKTSGHVRRIKGLVSQPMQRMESRYDFHGK